MNIPKGKKLHLVTEHKNRNDFVISYSTEANALVGADFRNNSDNDGNVVIAINPEALIGTRRFIEEVTKMTKAIKQAKKLEGIDEVLVPGERGDKIRSKILESGEIEIEDNLLQSLKDFIKSE